MNNRRFIVVPILLLSFVLLFGLVATAAAVPPDKEPLGAIETFTISGACPFDVLLEELQNESSITTFYDQDGNVRRFLITGALKVRLTNVTGGQSIALNVPGPAIERPQPDGSTLVIGVGPWLHLFVPGLPPLALGSGRTEFLIDHEGHLELLSITGNVRDVCPMLADA